MKDRRTPLSPPAVPVWAGRLAMVLVLLALGTLVTAPVLLQRRLGPLRRGAEAADEARTQVSRVQFALARQMSALRGALLTSDTINPGLYAEALALERSAYPALDSLTAALPEHTRDALVRLQTLSAAWHARLDEEAVLRRETAAPRALLARDLDLYERALHAARDLDAALAATARSRRAAIRRVERREDDLAAGMALAAFLAAVTVAWFGRQMRLLAREAAWRRAEAERALAGMQRLAASRERLVRGVTHDLKNPLGAAEGYAQLLLEGIEGELAPGQSQLVEGMRRSHASALALIDELLEFSRAEFGTVEFLLEGVDCAAVAREATWEYGASARVAGLELEARLPEGPLTCVTDRARLLRIIGNLLSNAVKYTPPPGRVVLEAKRADGPDAGERWIEVCVRDTGPGIPPGERERIFDEFHRLDGSGASGHGLGLATSRRIARLLGGDIIVGDADEGGAVFTLRLPVRPRGGGR